MVQKLALLESKIATQAAAIKALEALEARLTALEGNSGWAKTTSFLLHSCACVHQSLRTNYMGMYSSTKRDWVSGHSSCRDKVGV